MRIELDTAWLLCALRRIASRIRRTVCVLTSVDGTLGYIERGHESVGIKRPSFWMSMEPTKGPVSQDDKLKAGSMFGPAWMQFDSESRDCYHRKILPFCTWTVRSGKIVRLPKKSAFVQDYILSAKVF
jgi:hypothetical protein